MADDFPEPRHYNILLKTPTVIRVSVEPTILDNEDVLRVVEGKTNAWSLQYINRDKGICMLADVKSGGFLGLKGRPVSGMGGAGPVYRVKETQEWILKKTEGGYTISQVVVTGMEAYWFEDGDTIQTTYGPKHTWVFQPVPDISMT